MDSLKGSKLKDFLKDKKNSFPTGIRVRGCLRGKIIMASCNLGPTKAKYREG